MDIGIRLLIAKSIEAHLELLNAHLEPVCVEKDPEHIHQARVACRRLRALLVTFGSYVPNRKELRWDKSLRKLMRSLGRARDIDVQGMALEKFAEGKIIPEYHAGIRRLSLRLSQERNRLQPKVSAAVRRFKMTHTIQDLQKLRTEWGDLQTNQSETIKTLALRSVCSKQVNLFLARMLEFEPLIHRPKNVQELHDLRIAAKKLRYTMEIFRPVQPDEYLAYLKLIKKIQTLLGDVHDCDVWLKFMETFSGKEADRHKAFFGSRRGYYKVEKGVDYFASEKRNERKQIYAKFLTYWRRIQNDDKLTALRDYCAVRSDPFDESVS